MATLTPTNRQELRAVLQKGAPLDLPMALEDALDTLDGQDREIATLRALLRWRGIPDATINAWLAAEGWPDTEGRL